MTVAITRPPICDATLIRIKILWNTVPFTLFMHSLGPFCCVLKHIISFLVEVFTIVVQGLSYFSPSAVSHYWRSSWHFYDKFYAHHTCTKKMSWLFVLQVVAYM